MTISAQRIAEVIDPNRMPTPEQIAMIEAPHTPLLVVAGAGAGKTETMSQRVLFAVANSRVTPAEVLGLTFTRKAAGEFSERMRLRLRKLRSSGLWRPRRDNSAAAGADDAPEAALLETAGVISPIEADRPRVTTYDSFAGEIVREFALRLGEDPDAALATDARRWYLAARVLREWPAWIDMDRAESSIVTAVMGLSASLHSHMLEPEVAQEQFEQMAEQYTVQVGKGHRPVNDAAVTGLRDRAALIPLVTRFRELMREEGLRDFSSQAALATRVVREVAQVREVLRARFPMVMLDEYQDSSVSQVALLSELFGDGHAVTAVGDPQQAIYGWRAASAGAMAQFHQAFRSAGHNPATLTLATSWRNERRILTFANRVAALSTRAAAPTLPAPALEPRPGAGDGRVLHHRAPTVLDEAEAIAEYLDHHWNPADRHPHLLAEGHEPDKRESAAILCRRRQDFAAIAVALGGRGIPYLIVGLGGLLQQREVADVRAALTVAAFPERGDAVVHLLHRLRIGAKDLALLHQYSRDQASFALTEALARADGTPGRKSAASHVSLRDEASLGEAVSRPLNRSWTAQDGAKLSDQADERLTELRGILDSLRRNRHLPLGEQVVLAEQLLGLDVEAATLPSSAARSALDAFADEASSFSAQVPEADLAMFLDFITHKEKIENVAMPSEDISGVDDTVLLMTIHGAKGLEWDHVIVPGLNEGAFPKHQSRKFESMEVTDSAWFANLSDLPYPMRGDAADLPDFGNGDVPVLREEYDLVKELNADVDALKCAYGRHSVEEDYNVAYVAFTRARSTLLLTSSEDQGTLTQRPESRFVPRPELARAEGLYEELTVSGPAGDGGDATDTGAAGAAGAASTDPQALTSPPWPAPLVTEQRHQVLREAARMVRDAEAPDGHLSPGTWWQEAELLLSEEHRTPESWQSLLEKLTVTALVRTSADPVREAKRLLRPVPHKPSYVIDRGTNVHAWIENYLRRPSFETAVGAADIFGEEDEQDYRSSDEQHLISSFLASPWHRRAPVAVEEDLTEVIDGIVVPGVADAIFDDEAGTDIVDWKTGRKPGGRDLAAVEVQLHLYRLAWARRTGEPIEAIGGTFVYLSATAGRGVDEHRVPALGEAEVLALVREALTTLRRTATELRATGREVARHGSDEPITDHAQE